MSRVPWYAWLLFGLVVLLSAGLVWTLTRPAPTSLALRSSPSPSPILAVTSPAAPATTPPPPTRTATTTRTPSPTSTATPTFTPTPTPVITALPPLPQGFLITVRQTVQVHKTYDSAPSWWPNFPPFSLVRGRFTLVATGTIGAGIDFSKLNPEDVHRRGDSIDMTLPAPEVYHPVGLNLGETYIMEFPGIKGDQLNQLVHAENDATGLIENWAVDHGLLNEARSNAEAQVELGLRRLGFTSVRIQWREPTPF